MKRVYEDEFLQRCYEAGYDSVMNGVTEENCHFTLFSSPDKTLAWERGRKKALREGV